MYEREKSHSLLTLMYAAAVQSAWHCRTLMATPWACLAQVDLPTRVTLAGANVLAGTGRESQAL